MRPRPPQHRRTTGSSLLVVVAGAVFGGLLNPKFGANSASVNSFVATLLSVILGAAVGTAVGFLYRRPRSTTSPGTSRRYPLASRLPHCASSCLACRTSNPVTCTAWCAASRSLARWPRTRAGTSSPSAISRTMAVAVVAWFVWVPVNHSALHHPGVFPLVILDDLLASLFVGGLVGSVINLIPVRFMPGHTLASWHRGAWMAVFGVAAFGMTEIVLFPSRHNHAGHAPIVTIIVLFVLFGGGSLAFREYFSRRERKLEPASRWTSQRRDRSPPTKMRDPSAEIRRI